MKTEYVNIAQPCHKSWEDLQRIEGSQNRHCAECNRCIHDFSESTDSEIRDFLKSSKEERVCGIIPEPSFRTLWKRKKREYKSYPRFIIAALFLSVFVMHSCKSKKPVRKSPGYIELESIEE